MMGSFRREWLLASRNVARFINPMAFFIIVVCLFPMAISYDPDQLRVLAPGLIWVAVILSVIIGLPNLFQADYEDGSLEQWRLSPESITKRVLQRLSVHWVFSILPIVLLCPLIGQSFSMRWHDIGLLMLSILMGTPTLIMIGAIVSALLVTSRHASVLLAILVLPLLIPVLIFAVSLFQAPELSGILAILVGLLTLSLTLAPFAVVAALSIS